MSREADAVPGQSSKTVSVQLGPEDLEAVRTIRDFLFAMPGLLRRDNVTAVIRFALRSTAYRIVQMDETVKNVGPTTTV